MSFPVPEVGTDRVGSVSPLGRRCDGQWSSRWCGWGGHGLERDGRAFERCRFLGQVDAEHLEEKGAHGHPEPDPTIGEGGRGDRVGAVQFLGTGDEPRPGVFAELAEVVAVFVVVLPEAAARPLRRFGGFVADATGRRAAFLRPLGGGPATPSGAFRGRPATPFRPFGSGPGRWSGGAVGTGADRLGLAMRVGQFASAVPAGAGVGAPVRGAERAGVVRIVGSVAVDDPRVAGPVPQMRRLVARGTRVLFGPRRVGGIGVVAVRTRRVGIGRDGVNHLLKVGGNVRPTVLIRPGMAVCGQPEIEYGRSCQGSLLLWF